jgi:hypothetical protein
VNESLCWIGGHSLNTVGLGSVGDDLVSLGALRARPSPRLTTEHARAIEHKSVQVLDIPDDYKYMNAELVELLAQSVSVILDLG